ncbi:MAG: hypothetical protein HY998_04425 [candidate division NC10 bacterium]|nr:hypothetical protein [candidate division NC10 bacterium]
MRAAREATTIATFLGFARFPWMSYQRNGDSSIVRCEDLRFKYSQRNDFAAEVALSKDGRVVSQELRF